MYWVMNQDQWLPSPQIVSSAKVAIQELQILKEKGLIYQQYLRKNLIWKFIKDELTRKNTSDSGVRLAAES